MVEQKMIRFIFSLFSFLIPALYLNVLYFLHGGPTTMGPTCHRLHLTYITSPPTLLYSPFLFHRPNPPTTHSLTFLNNEAKMAATKFEWEKGQHMGGRPTLLGRPPGYLLLYKIPSSLHSQTPHMTSFSRQTSCSQPLSVQREFGREGKHRKSREEGGN